MIDCGARAACACDCSTSKGLPGGPADICLPNCVSDELRDELRDERAAVELDTVDLTLTEAVTKVWLFLIKC